MCAVQADGEAGVAAAAEGVAQSAACPAACEAAEAALAKGGGGGSKCNASPPQSGSPVAVLTGTALIGLSGGPPTPADDGAESGARCGEAGASPAQPGLRAFGGQAATAASVPQPRVPGAMRTALLQRSGDAQLRLAVPPKTLKVAGSPAGGTPPGTPSRAASPAASLAIGPPPQQQQPDISLLASAVAAAKLGLLDQLRAAINSSAAVAVAK